MERLGPFAGYAKIDDISRPVLQLRPTQRLRIEAGDVPESRIHFAGALVEAPSDGHSECRIRLLGSDDPLELAHLEPGSDSAWMEARASLPARANATLEFECAPGVRAVWARPLLTPPASPTPAPLIVLLSLDTLRGDHVTGFGAPPDLTPNLGRLGAEGARLVSATSEGTWTVPSHFALFHSRLFGYQVDDPPVVPLAQALSQGGFLALGLTGGGFMSAGWQFHLGFDHYAEQVTYASSLDSVLRDALVSIERFDTAPTFLYLHSYEVHKQTPAELQWQARRPVGGPMEPDPTQLEEARILYEKQVRAADASVGPFLEALKEIGARRPTLLVVISDHGEAFGEHANFRHGSMGPPRATLHDEVVHVPIIVWGPKLVPPGREHDRAVMLGDIAPSLLAAAAVPTPPSMRGRNLWPEWSGTGPSPEDRGGVSQTRNSWSLRDPTRKLVVTRRGDRLDVELYELERDPEERTNRAADRPGVVREMSARLREQLRRAGAQADEEELGFPVCPYCRPQDRNAFWQQALRGANIPWDGVVKLDPTTRQRLRQLGYVESE